MGFIKRIIAGIVINALALYVVTYALEEISYTGGWKFFIMAGIIIGLLNTLVKPLLKLVSLPFVIITAGLFLIPINAFLLWVTKTIIQILDILGIQFLISGWLNYLIASIIFGIANWFIHIFIKTE